MAQLIYFQKEKVEYNVSHAPKFYKEYYENIKYRARLAEKDLSLDLYELSFIRWLRTHIVSGRTGIREDGKTWILATRDIISETLRCSVSTATRVLRRLEDKGYIKRKCFKYCAARYFTIVCGVFFYASSCSQSSATKVDILYLNTSLKYNISSLEKISPKHFAFREKDDLIFDNLDYFRVEKPIFVSSQAEKSSLNPKNVSREMLLAYNEAIGGCIEMNESISRQLFFAYKRKFESSMVGWKNYVMTKIHGSINDPVRFLFYILKIKTIDSYKASIVCNVGYKYGDKDSKAKVNAVVDHMAIRIIEYHEHEEEKRILQKFYNEYGLGAMLNHFSYGRIHLRGNNLRIYFKNDWFMNRFVNDNEIALFKEWCEKFFNFECCIDGRIERLGEAF